MIAIIGGTGVENFPLEGDAEPVVVTTHWGTASLLRGTLHSKRVYFMARHGSGHKIAPHLIPYRANIAALVKLGVKAVLATTATGGLRPQLGPGSLILLDDLIDYTRERTGKTFFDGTDGHVVHADMTRPYSEELRAILLQTAVNQNIPLLPAGTYLCNDGPRYETAAEVRLFGQVFGADVAGMTGIPETTLAREAGLHYAGISVVTNAGAGLSSNLLTHQEVEAEFRRALPRLIALLSEAVARIDTADLPAIGPGVPIRL